MARKSFTEDSAKEQTRKAIEEQIFRRWPNPDKRKTLLATTMPSAQWSEAEMYVRVGIPPNNITVIENDPKDYAKMWAENQEREENHRWNMFSKPLGMQESIAALPQRQDIIVLDPYGGISDMLVGTIEEIFRGEHLKPEGGILSVNRLARESSLGKQRVGEPHVIQQHAHKRRELVLGVMQGNREVAEVEEETIRMQEQIKNYSAKDLREDGLVSLVLQEATFGRRVQPNGSLVKAIAWDPRARKVLGDDSNASIESVRKEVQKLLLPGEESTIMKAALGQRMHIQGFHGEDLAHLAYNILTVQQIIEGNPLKLAHRTALTYISDSGKRYVQDIFSLEKFSSQQELQQPFRQFFELLGITAKYDGHVDVDVEEFVIRAKMRYEPTARDKKQAERIASTLNPKKLLAAYNAFGRETAQEESTRYTQRIDLSVNESPKTPNKTRLTKSTTTSRRTGNI